MKKNSCWSKVRNTFVLLLFLIFIQATFAQNDVLVLKESPSPAGSEERPAPPFPGDETEPDTVTYLLLYEKWHQFEVAWKVGDQSASMEFLQDIVALRKKLSIPRLSAFAGTIVLLGDQLAAGGKRDQASAFYQAAIQLDPALPTPFYGLAKTQLSGGVTGIPAAFRYTLSGIVAPTSTPLGKVGFFTKYFMVTIAALLLTAFVLAIIMLLKYNGLLKHEAVEAFGTKYHPKMIHLIVWSLLFLPVFFFFGFFWLAPFWLAVFWRYGRLTEKVMAILFILVFAAANPIYSRVSQIARSAVDPAISTYLTAFSEGPSVRSIQDLEKYRQAQPADKDAAILLSYLYKMNQNTKAAIDILQKHIVAYPEDARAYANLAVIYFQQGETDLALRMTQKASDLDRRNGIYDYNLSKILRAKFNFVDAEVLRTSATKKSPELAGLFEVTPVQTLVDAVPRPNLVWERITHKMQPFSEQFYNPFTFAAVALIGLMLLLNSRSKKRAKARACKKCGSPFCKKCQSGSKASDFCVQCVHIYITRDGVSPASRKDKLQQIEKYVKKQQLFARLCSLIFPGSGSLYLNNILAGMIILLVWFLLGTLLIYNTWFSQLSFFEPAVSVRIVSILSLIIMAILYLIANLALLKKHQA